MFVKLLIAVWASDGLYGIDKRGGVGGYRQTPSVRYGRYCAAAYAEAGYAGQEARVNGVCVCGGD